MDVNSYTVFIYMAYNIEYENALPIKEHDVDQIVGINHIESHQQVEYHIPTKGFHLSRYQFHVGSCRAFLSPKKSSNLKLEKVEWQLFCSKKTPLVVKAGNGKPRVQ